MSNKDAFEQWQSNTYVHGGFTSKRDFDAGYLAAIQHCMQGEPYGYVSDSTYAVIDSGTIRKTPNDVFTTPVFTHAYPEIAEQPRLKVRLCSFPESNGKRNWTAMFVRTEKWDGLIGNAGGITIERGEFWNRVAYEAERAKFLIGERDTEPHILDYGDDIHTPEEWQGEVRGPMYAKS